MKRCFLLMIVLCAGCRQQQVPAPAAAPIKPTASFQPIAAPVRSVPASVSPLEKPLRVAVNTDAVRAYVAFIGSEHSKLYAVVQQIKQGIRDDDESARQQGRPPDVQETARLTSNAAVTLKNIVYEVQQSQTPSECRILSDRFCGYLTYYADGVTWTGQASQMLLSSPHPTQAMIDNFKAQSSQFMAQGKPILDAANEELARVCTTYGIPQTFKIGEGL